ncbi:MAG TPA: hypothetical protein VJ939_03240 [Bacteroidales bacterium]|nr:hypothetical protein [Bacteroidales bacterium]
MKERLLLYAGILLLAGGIVLKSVTEVSLLAMSLIGTGVLAKITYVFLKIKSGEYKPGSEAILLIGGLLLFFSGIYLRAEAFDNFNPAYLIFTGIAMKVTFIILFIIKIRQKSHV